ncbi:MAG TPA: tyrosinase family protein [Rhizomicrobium sp.]
MTSQSYTRRSIVKTGALGAAAGLIPFPIWYEQYAAAGPVMTRYSIQSAQGAAMLAKYKTAVGIMMGKSAGDPCGWNFQWYTHGVPDNTTKAAQVAALPVAQQALANLMWNTCQAHKAGTVEDYFLPWHRMYVYFFERIIRKVLNDPTFTLPYWDYTSASHRAVPPDFLSPSSGNALYRPDRNDGSGGTANVKGGQPIDFGIPAPSPLDTDFQSAMAETTYSPSGAKQGFCMNLDQGLHGNDVHVLTGNTVGMGRVPWAANDPVFYTHHCNIDRIWASWNRNGGKNPTSSSWLNHTFTFADENCNQVIGTINDFKAIAPLSYTYDSFPGSKIFIDLSSILAKLKYLAVIQVIHLPIPPGPYHVILPAVQEGLKQPLAATLQALKPAERLHLVIRNLKTNVQPGVLYRVYVGLQPESKELTNDAVPVGTFGFFDAEAMPGMDMTGDNGKFFSFDVTEALQGLARRKRLGDRLNITFAPLGRGNAKAVPVIGSVELVQQ